MEDVLNSNVASNVYGTVDEAGEWRALYGPKDQKPLPVSLGSKKAVSYDAYIDQLYCEPPGMLGLPKRERDSVWKGVTAKRRAASRVFTFRGEAGEHYAPLVEEQKRCLTMQEDPLRYYTIIPSFFTLVNALSELDWPFTLIFRTFGSDLENVLAEWKEFVQGDHVCKPRGPFLERLRKGGADPLTGCMYRDGERLFLCCGPCVSAYTLNSKTLNEEHGTSTKSICKELESMPGFKEVKVTSFGALGDDLQQYFAGSGNVGGLVDYYPSWAQAAERRVGGKVFPVSTEGSRFHVFFDDNIALGDERSIVDLRDASTGESIIGLEKEEPFCVPVNAYRAIVEDNYFVERLAYCLELQCRLQQCGNQQAHE